MPLSWISFVAALLLLALAVCAFAYGVFLLSGEENAPFVGGWLVALAVVMAVVAALLLWVWVRRLLERREAAA